MSRLTALRNTAVSVTFSVLRIAACHVAPCATVEGGGPSQLQSTWLRGSAESSASLYLSAQLQQQRDPRGARPLGVLQLLKKRNGGLERIVVLPVYEVAKVGQRVPPVHVDRQAGQRCLVDIRRRHCAAATRPESRAGSVSCRAQKRAGRWRGLDVRSAVAIHWLPLGIWCCRYASRAWWTAASHSSTSLGTSAGAATATAAAAAAAAAAMAVEESRPLAAAVSVLGLSERVSLNNVGARSPLPGGGLLCQPTAP